MKKYLFDAHDIEKNHGISRYYSTAQSREYPSILYGYFDSWLFFYCKKGCLTSRLRALRFSIHFAFPTLREMSRKT